MQWTLAYTEAAADTVVILLTKHCRVHC